MRYAWHLRDAYFAERACGWNAWLLDCLLAHLRAWDRKTAERVTHFVAISKTVQARITQCYGRESTVIYPPVDTSFYRPDHRPRDDYYLVVSACAPYKRIDLAISACRMARRRLVVIGSGQELDRLRRLAEGSDVQFLGWQPNAVVRDHFRRCQALLFPGEEDFGIVPLEAHACGTPVIAFARGGATETVIPMGECRDPTGVWFAHQTTECLVEAIHRFEAQRSEFSPMAARRQALRFDVRRFEDELFAFLDGVLGVRRGPSSAVRRAA
jgi:glycosyltransferase involved in cell wall biosynthesis